MLEIIFFPLFLVSITASAIVLPAILNHHSDQELDEFGVNIHGQGR